MGLSNSSKRSVVCGILLVQMLLGGCASLMSSASSQLAENLSAAMLDSNDPETVKTAIPAYLLLIESLLRNSPDNEGILRAASSLNGAFAGAFVEDESRAQLLSDKALDYALRALCVHDKASCGLKELKLEQLQQHLQKMQARDIEAIYAVGVAWTSWIQVHSSDWNAIAELSKVRSIMERMIELDESWDKGGPHLYMGGLDTLLPASMGGKPEEGRMHFERAIEFSNGKNMMIKVVYAEQYARLVFDKELHDRLLNEVLEGDPVEPGITLSNSIAQLRAKLLLEESDEYF